MENNFIKKIEWSEKQWAISKASIQTILELANKYKLNALFNLARLAKFAFSIIKNAYQNQTNTSMKKIIKQIFNENYDRYGYWIYIK